MRILIIEDNRRLNDSLRATLVENGYAVDTAYDGVEGEDMALLAQYDVIILDVMLPKRDGIEVCRSLRDQKVAAPILMLTARDGLDDRVLGLDSGADDYLIKPFEIKELRARLRALLRRDSGNKSSNLVIDDLRLDPSSHYVWRGEIPLDLTAKEYALLEYLMRNPNRLITREMVVAHLWDYDQAIASNVVDVYIRRLRRKVDDPYPLKLIETIRGAGYRLRDPQRK
ncbi:MAG: response regulator transcription factor [Chloroflexi bacterium]|nr:response regulator transcription factor [Chloroflexota bacterium]